MSLSYNQEKLNFYDQVVSATSDHEDTGIAASYTMGGMTVSAFKNWADNVVELLVKLTREQGYFIFCVLIKR